MTSNDASLPPASRTTVVHVRPEPYDVYIGREHRSLRLERSPWANPYVIGPSGTRSEVLAFYRRWLTTQRPDLMARLGELKGKRLACWCKPMNCHGDILAELADALPAPGDPMTPRPWHTRPALAVRSGDHGPDIAIVGLNDELIAEVFNRVKSDQFADNWGHAALIVDAVNRHDELLEALKALADPRGHFGFCLAGYSKLECPPVCIAARRAARVPGWDESGSTAP